MCEWVDRWGPGGQKGGGVNTWISHGWERHRLSLARWWIQGSDGPKVRVQAPTLPFKLCLLEEGMVPHGGMITWATGQDSGVERQDGWAEQVAQLIPSPSHLLDTGHSSEYNLA
jgi:hypothetical protein